MSQQVKLEIIEVVDSHTGGEPTRLIVAGGPKLSGTLSQQLSTLRRDHDRFRTLVLNEPRGAEHMVGALLTTSPDPRCAAGVIFFNNVGYLGMCGHGLMGVMVSLAHMGRIAPGEHLIDTPVGQVGATLNNRNNVTVRNVPSYRTKHDIRVQVYGLGTVTGDVAWSGNWFFLCHDHSQQVIPSHIPQLTAIAVRIRQSLIAQGICGDDGAEIDHIELMKHSPRPGINARSFVLCPGSAYDRSPCGTGTSAVIACEYAAGRLKLEETWHQESVIGSVFTAHLEQHNHELIASISGTAFVNGECRIIADPLDPFAWGIA